MHVIYFNGSDRIDWIDCNGSGCINCNGYDRTDWISTDLHLWFVIPHWFMGLNGLLFMSTMTREVTE
jgi:hypothetical protein